MTAQPAAINVGDMLTRLPRNNVDWDQELARERVLRLRQQRWRTNSIHIFKLARKAVIAWLLVRHGTDLSDAVTTITRMGSR